MRDPASLKGIRSAMYYRKIIGGLGVAVIIALIATDGVQGGSTYISGTGWQVAQAMDPLTLALSPPAFIVLILSWRLPTNPRSSASAHKILIFLALFIDFALFSLAWGPPVHLIDLFLEAAAVGEFHWSYARTFPRATDIVSALLGLLLMIVFLRWYGRIPWLRRETPGCICTGVAFEATTQDPKWWQIAMVPVKIVWAIIPFAEKLHFGKEPYEDFGGYRIRCVR